MVRFILLSLLLTLLLYGEASDHQEQSWGLGAVMRSSSIPYHSQEQHLSSFVPLLFYEDSRFFVDGLEAGVILYRNDAWRFSLLTRMRFVDVPEEYSDSLQGDVADFGFQLRHHLDQRQSIDLEFLRDARNHQHANLSYGCSFEYGALQMKPYATLRYKESAFNSRYYALEAEAVGAGIDTAVGFDIRYHVTSNLYLIGSAQRRWLDRNARDAVVTDESHSDEMTLGIGLFNDRSKPYKSHIRNRPYIRIAQGWATPLDLTDIFAGKIKKDVNDNQMTSLFYGHPLTDELFGLPLDLYLTPGVAWHWSSAVQATAQEYVLGLKVFYTFDLPLHPRFGVAQGLSYINHLTYIESSEMEAKGYRSSQLLNYLDFSLDFHLGDMIGKSAANIWLGYSIHHRSAMFATASHYGRIKGGSNYNTLYLQWHF